MTTSGVLTGLTATLLLTRHRLLAGLSGLASGIALAVGSILARRDSSGSQRIGGRAHLAERVGDLLFDASILVPLAWVMRTGSNWDAILAIVGLGVAYLASYQRARGEALGYTGSESLGIRCRRGGRRGHSGVEYRASGAACRFCPAVATVSTEVEMQEVEKFASTRESASDRLTYLSIRATQWLGMHLPRRIGLPAAQSYFRLLYEGGAGQREVVAGNLSRVLGHPPDSPLVQTATRECFALYGRYWYETFALRTMPPEEVDRRFSVEGLDHADRALAQGRGVVLTLPHMGNWDAAGHWLCIKGYRMTAVAEELKPRSVFELFLRHRRALGMGIVPLSTAASVGGKLLELLRENQIITLVADRDLTGRGVVVDMFGARRRLPAGPAYLALATDTPLSVCAVFTTPTGW